MTKNINVGFDLDGVACLTTEAMLDVANARGLLNNRRKEEVVKYKFADCFPEVEDASIIHMLIYSEIFGVAEACSTAIEAMKFCKDFGAGVHVVTARKDLEVDVSKITEEWATKKGLPHDTIVYKSAEDKHAHCLENNFCAFVEDRLDTANEIGQDIPVFLIKEPWNDPKTYGVELSKYVIRGERKELLAFLAGVLFSEESKY